MSRTISTSLRLEIVGVYYHSNIKKTDICKKYGISLATLYRILRTFAPIKSIKQRMSEESPRPTSSSLNDTEEELLRLRLRIKELERQLYHAEMARDAYDYMIELAEQRYHIRVRRNSDAK